MPADLAPALATVWFQPPPALETAWFGPDGQIAAVLGPVADPAAIPLVIGPQGSQGQTGNPGAPGPPGDVILPATLRGGAF